MSSFPHTDRHRSASSYVLSHLQAGTVLSAKQQHYEETLASALSSSLRFLKTMPSALENTSAFNRSATLGAYIKQQSSILQERLSGCLSETTAVATSSTPFPLSPPVRSYLEEIALVVQPYMEHVFREWQSSLSPPYEPQRSGSVGGSLRTPSGSPSTSPPHSPTTPHERTTQHCNRLMSLLKAESDDSIRYAAHFVAHEATYGWDYFINVRLHLSQVQLFAVVGVARILDFLCSEERPSIQFTSQFLFQGLLQGRSGRRAKHEIPPLVRHPTMLGSDAGKVTAEGAYGRCGLTTPTGTFFVKEQSPNEKEAEWGFTKFVSSNRGKTGTSLDGKRAKYGYALVPEDYPSKWGYVPHVPAPEFLDWFKHQSTARAVTVSDIQRYLAEMQQLRIQQMVSEVNQVQVPMRPSSRHSVSESQASVDSSGSTPRLDNIDFEQESNVVVSFNEWLGGRRAVFRGLLSGEDLSVGVFSCIDFSGSIFIDCQMGAMQNARLESCTFERVTFAASDALDAASLQRSRLVGCLLSKLSLNNSNLRRVSVNDCDLSHCAFSNCDVKDISVDVASLKTLSRNGGVPPELAHLIPTSSPPKPEHKDNSSGKTSPRSALLSPLAVRRSDPKDRDGRTTQRWCVPVENLAVIPRAFLSKFTEIAHAFDSATAAGQMVRTSSAPKPDPSPNSAPAARFSLAPLPRSHIVTLHATTPGLAAHSLAIYYCWHSPHEYKFIVWFRAFSRESLMHDYWLFQEDKKLGLNPLCSDEILIQRVLRWFEQHSDWLVVYDAGDNTEGLSEFLLPRYGGQVLLLSRSLRFGHCVEMTMPSIANAAALFGCVAHLPPVNWPSDELFSFAADECSTDSEHKIVPLLQHLSCAPLPIVLTAAHSLFTRRSPADLLAAIQKDSSDSSSAAIPLPPLSSLAPLSLNASVSAICNASLFACEQSVFDRGNCALSRHLLTVCGYLHYSGIPVLFLESWIHYIAPHLPTKPLLYETLCQLSQLRLLRINKSPHGILLCVVHPLVQQFVRDTHSGKLPAGSNAFAPLPTANRDGSAAVAANGASELMPVPAYNTAFFESICSSLCATFDYLSEKFSDQTRVHLFAVIMRHFQCLQQHLEIFVANVRPPVPPLSLADLNLRWAFIMSCVYCRPNKAYPLLEDAIRIRQANVAQKGDRILQDRRFPVFLREVAMSRGFELDLPHRATILEQCVAMQEKELCFGPEHEEVGRTLTLLAATYGAQGLVPIQQATLTRALTLLEKRLSKNNVEVALVQCDLAVAYAESGESEKERALLRQARTVAYTFDPLANPQASGLNSHNQASAPVPRLNTEALESLAYLFAQLGKAYNDLGDFKFSRQLLERSVTIQEAVRGPEALDVARRLMDLGTVYASIEDPIREREVLERAVKIFTSHLGPDHGDVISAQVRLSDTHRRLMDHETQRELLEQALGAQEAQLGPDHVLLTPTMDKLAMACGEVGDTHSQRALLQKALEIQERAYGAEHHRLAPILVHIAHSHKANHDTNRQIQALERALRLQEAHYGPNHFNVANTLVEIGAAYRDLQQPGDTLRARSYLERALKIQEVHYGIDHVSLCPTLSLLAHVSSDLRDHKKQRALLERALELREQHHGDAHPQVAATMVQLASALHELKEPAGAQALLEKALLIQENRLGPGHVELSPTLVQLAHAVGELGDANRQIQLLKRALQVEEIEHGTQSALLAPTITKLADAYSRVGDQGRRITLLERALALVEHHEQRIQSNIANGTSSSFSSSMSPSSQSKSARTVSSAAIRSALNESAPPLFFPNYDLACALQEQKDYVQARHHLQQAWNVLYSQPQQDSLHFTSLRQMLDDAFASLDQLHPGTTPEAGEPGAAL